MELYNLSIKDYNEILSSKSSMPGGGSAASVVASLGVSLALMVCNLTIGKEKYKDSEELVNESIKKLESLKNDFINMIEEDKVLYGNIESVWSLPKNTDEEKKIREEKMEEACKTCNIIPEKIMVKSLEALKIIEPLLFKTNMTCISDLGDASCNLKAATDGAYLNIVINKKFIKDNKYNDEILNKANAILEEVDKLNKTIYGKVLDYLKS